MSAFRIGPLDEDASALTMILVLSLLMSVSCTMCVVNQTRHDNITRPRVRRRVVTLPANNEAASNDRRDGGGKHTAKVHPATFEAKHTREVAGAQSVPRNAGTTPQPRGSIAAAPSNYQQQAAIAVQAVALAQAPAQSTSGRHSAVQQEAGGGRGGRQSVAGGPRMSLANPAPAPPSFVHQRAISSSASSPQPPLGRLGNISPGGGVGPAGPAWGGGANGRLSPHGPASGFDSTAHYFAGAQPSLCPHHVLPASPTHTGTTSIPDGYNLGSGAAPAPPGMWGGRGSAGSGAVSPFGSGPGPAAGGGGCLWQPGRQAMHGYGLPPGAGGGPRPRFFASNHPTGGGTAYPFPRPHPGFMPGGPYGPGQQGPGSHPHPGHRLSLAGPPGPSRSLLASYPGPAARSTSQQGHYTSALGASGAAAVGGGPGGGRSAAGRSPHRHSIAHPTPYVPPLALPGSNVAEGEEVVRY
jgi:hypothetical protein